MASTVAMCRSVLRSQSQDLGSGKRCLSLDGWVCQPSARPVSTASSASSSGSSCTTEKGLSCMKTVALEARVNEEGEACSRESRCVTPKSKKHRIPLVDVDLCPPAPKKARANGRLSAVCSAEGSCGTQSAMSMARSDGSRLQLLQKHPHSARRERFIGVSITNTTQGVTHVLQGICLDDEHLERALEHE